MGMARTLKGAACKLDLAFPAWSLSQHGRPVTGWAPLPCSSSPTMDLLFALDHLPDRLLGTAVFISPQWECWAERGQYPVPHCCNSMLPVCAGHQIDIVHSVYGSTAQFNLLCVIPWCHRTTWTGLQGLWRWTCQQICDEFCVSGSCQHYFSIGMFSTGWLFFVIKRCLLQLSLALPEHKPYF